MRLIDFSLLVLLVVLPPVTVADNLLEIFTLAAKRDPELRAARENYQAVKESTPQARASLLPNLSLSASSSENKQTNNGIRSDFSADNVSLVLTQPVFNYKFLMTLKQAKTTVRKAGIDLSAAYQALILRVAERYFAVLSAKDNLTFLQAEKKSFSRKLEEAQKRFKVGLIAITGVHEARSARDLSAAQVIEAENILANAIEKLREITGQTHDRLAELKDTIPLTSPAPRNMNQWTKTALRQNLQLQSTQQDIEIARIDIKIKNSGHLPTLDLVASKSKNNTTGGFFGARESDTGTIELRLNVPIFSGGLTRSQTKQARHKYQQAVELHEKQQRTTLSQTRNAYRGILAGISRVKALKQAIISARSALRATQAGFEVGTRTIVDVLNSQRELFKAKSNYSRARHDYVLNLLRLKQAAGTLSIDDLKAVNSWLRPHSTTP